MAAIRSPGGQIGTPRRVLPADFVVRGAAIAGDGEAFLADATGRVAVRPAGGNLRRADAAARGRGPVTARPRCWRPTPGGDVLAAYRGTGGIVVGRRPAGGGWSAPAALTGVERRRRARRGAVGRRPGHGHLRAEQRRPRGPAARTNLLVASIGVDEPAVVEQVNAAGLDADTGFDGAGLDMDGAGASAAARSTAADGLLGRGVVQLAVAAAIGAARHGRIADPARGQATRHRRCRRRGVRSRRRDAGHVELTTTPERTGLMARWIGPVGADAPARAGPRRGP